MRAWSTNPAFDAALMALGEEESLPPPEDGWPFHFYANNGVLLVEQGGWKLYLRHDPGPSQVSILRDALTAFLETDVLDGTKTV